MNNWTCAKCGAINNIQATTAYCVNCGSSKWAKMPMVADPQGGYFATQDKVICPDCARLKAELAETKTVLEAWQNVFGTLNLSHAHARLESAEAICARLNKRNEDWYQFTKAIGEIIKCLPSTFPDENEHIKKRVVELKESNARLKALLADVWKLLDNYEDIRSEELDDKCNKLEARIKREGIE